MAFYTTLKRIPKTRFSLEQGPPRRYHLVFMCLEMASAFPCCLRTQGGTKLGDKSTVTRVLAQKHLEFSVGVFMRDPLCPAHPAAWVQSMSVVWVYLRQIWVLSL